MGTIETMEPMQPMRVMRRRSEINGRMDCDNIIVEHSRPKVPKLNDAYFEKLFLDLNLGPPERSRKRSRKFQRRGAMNTWKHPSFEHELTKSTDPCLEVNHFTEEKSREQSKEGTGKVAPVKFLRRLSQSGIDLAKQMRSLLETDEVNEDDADNFLILHLRRTESKNLLNIIRRDGDIM